MKSSLLVGTHRPLYIADRMLTSLSENVSVPAYDRTALTPAIVHVGVGGFHRAHQAVYLDDLARLGDSDWGEIGIGLRSPAMRDAIVPQDCLFTVVERGVEHDRARIVGSMVKYLYGPDDPAAVLSVLADARTRVVTLTITGSGYNLDDSGRFRTHAPEVLADLASPQAPATVFGYLVEALDRRRQADRPAFTVLSCDNVADNGDATRAGVVGFARLRDKGLAKWIEANASFPSSMVDRIAPETGTATRSLVTEQFGVRDRWPVLCEPFRQWFVEDDFCNGRPPLDRVGVQFVSNVAPYKLLKNRLLNASHSAIGYLGYLAGYRTTSDAMANPLFFDYITALMGENIAPLLPKVPDVDVDAYQRSVLERFANPCISDELSRLCGRGSVKMPAYLLPSLVHARRQRRPSMLLTLAVAAWFCYLGGHDLDGTPMEVNDPYRDVLQPLAMAAGNDPRPLLGERSIFGELGEDAEFATILENMVNDLRAYGPLATVGERLGASLSAA